MDKVIRIALFKDTSYLHIFSFFILGVIHKKNDEGYIYGFVFGIWNFQIQLTLGYVEKLELGEFGSA